MTTTPAPAWLLTAHVATAVGLLGTDLALLMFGIHGLLGADPITVYPAMARLSSWVMAPLAVAALATGGWLTLRGRPALLRAGWVRSKAAITGGLVPLLLLVAVPGLAEVADLALATDAVPDRDRAVYVAVPALTVALLLLNATLGLRARAPQR